MMTTEPNGVVQPVHEQAMPVVLMPAEQMDAWLNGQLSRGRAGDAEAGTG
jgi:putative SOS response-associated peptidase YedK